jgi:hypothetical protein
VGSVIPELECHAQLSDYMANYVRAMDSSRSITSSSRGRVCVSDNDSKQLLSDNEIRADQQ